MNQPDHDHKFEAFRLKTLANRLNCLARIMERTTPDITPRFKSARRDVLDALRILEQEVPGQ
jgi:hypothetical protein